MQTFVKNERYMIKTPYGWENFEGVAKTEQTKEMVEIVTKSGTSLKATLDHPLLIDEKIVKAGDISVGDVVETMDGPVEVIDLRYSTNDVVYDIFNSETHTILGNGIKQKQCDELAFANSKTARAMWSSIYPTLSCLEGNTYVLSQRGFVKIKHYFRGLTEPGLYFELQNERIYGEYRELEKLTHGYISPPSSTIVIKTATGYRVEVTPEHPLRVVGHDVMIPAMDVEIGNYLRCDIGMNVFGRGYYSGCITHSDDGYPEYIMMYDRESCIRFLRDEYGLSRPYLCLYQQKLLYANLGIVTVIDDDDRLVVASGSKYDFKDIFGFIPEVVPVLVTDNFMDAIVSIEEGCAEVTYDFTVPGSRSFLQNGIMGSNTGGACIITSTPSDDETLFAEIWNGAVKNIDENGNDTDVGINGFKALKIKWDEHPERDESYKQMQIAAFGEEAFRREHELEFISMEETLIDPVFLADMKGIEPISKTGQVRWYKKLDKELIYIVAYDPSLGTGRDNSAIVIYEFPTMIQVGEWIHNKSDVPTQLNVLKKILDKFEDAGFDEDNVYWSLENNSIGEAPLVMIKNEVGADEFFGTMLNERKKRGSRMRGGYFTDHTEKIKACNRFKIWLEQGKLTVMSKPLVAELKGFISQGRTYKARPGDKDDIVMATLLAVRMAEVIMKEEEEYLEELGVTASNMGDNDDDDDGWDSPMPFL